FILSNTLYNINSILGILYNIKFVTILIFVNTYNSLFNLSLFIVFNFSFNLLSSFSSIFLTYFIVFLYTYIINNIIQKIHSLIIVTLPYNINNTQLITNTYLKYLLCLILKSLFHIFNIILIMFIII